MITCSTMHPCALNSSHCYFCCSTTTLVSHQLGAAPSGTAFLLPFILPIPRSQVPLQSEAAHPAREVFHSIYSHIPGTSVHFHIRYYGNVLSDYQKTVTLKILKCRHNVSHHIIDMLVKFGQNHLPTDMHFTIIAMLLFS